MLPLSVRVTIYLKYRLQIKVSCLSIASCWKRPPETFIRQMSLPGIQLKAAFALACYSKIRSPFGRQALKSSYFTLLETHFQLYAVSTKFWWLMHDSFARSEWFVTTIIPNTTNWLLVHLHDSITWTNMLPRFPSTDHQRNKLIQLQNRNGFGWTHK